MAATLSVNGKPQRKQLSDQLDRMDGIIDCLADALPDAVADACRDGARQAVKDAVIEILTNPELRTLIGSLAPVPIVQPEPAPVPSKPSVWSRMRAKLATARNAAAKRVAAVKDAVATRLNAARTTISVGVDLFSTMLAMKKILLVGICVGVVASLIGYASPHGFVAVIGGIGAGCTAIVAQVRGWFQRKTA